MPASILEEEVRLQKARVADRDELIRNLTRRMYTMEAELQQLQIAAKAASSSSSTLPESRRRDCGTCTGSDWIVWSETVALLAEAEADFRGRIVMEHAHWLALALTQRWFFESSGVVVTKLRHAGDAFSATGTLPLPPPSTEVGRASVGFASPSPARVTSMGSLADSDAGLVDVYFVGGGGIPQHTFRTSLVSPFTSQVSSLGRAPSVNQQEGSPRNFLFSSASRPHGQTAPAALSPYAALLGHLTGASALLQRHIDGIVASLIQSVGRLEDRVRAAAQTAVSVASQRCQLFVEESYQRHALAALSGEGALTLLTQVLLGQTRLFSSHVKQLMKENTSMLDFGMQEACHAHTARAELEAIAAAGKEEIWNAKRSGMEACEEGLRATVVANEGGERSRIMSHCELRAARIAMDAQRRGFQEVLRSAEVSLRHEAEPHQRTLIRDCESEALEAMLAMHMFWRDALDSFRRFNQAKSRGMFVEYAIGSLQEVVHPLLADAARSFWGFLRTELLPSIATLQRHTDERVRHALRRQGDVVVEAFDERRALTYDHMHSFQRLVFANHRELRLLEVSEQRGREACFVMHHACIAAADGLEMMKRSSADVFAVVLGDWAIALGAMVSLQRRFERRVAQQQQARAAVMDQEASGRRFLVVWEAEHAYERILMPMHAAAVTNHIRSENDELIQSIESDTIAIVRDVTLREQKLLALFADTSLIPMHRHAARMLLALHEDFSSVMADFLRNDVSLSEKRWKHRASADASRQIATASAAVSQTLEKSYESSLVLFVNLRDELEAAYRQRLLHSVKVEQRRLADFGSTAVTDFISQRQAMLLQHMADGFSCRDQLLVERCNTTLRNVLTNVVVSRIASMQQHEAVYCGNLVREALLLARRMTDECHHSTFERLAAQQQLAHLRRTGPLAERDALRSALQASEAYIGVAEKQKAMLALQTTRHLELTQQEQREVIALLLTFARGLVAFAKADRLMRDAMSAAGSNARHTAQALAGRAGAAVEGSLLASVWPPAPPSSFDAAPSSPQSLDKQRWSVPGRTLVAPARDSPSDRLPHDDGLAADVQRRLDALLASPRSGPHPNSSLPAETSPTRMSDSEIHRAASIRSASPSTSERLEALFYSPLGDAERQRSLGRYSL